MKKAVYNLILKSEPEGGYTAIVPSLPGCVTYGRNLEEAKEMARDAIKAYVASLKKHNESVPTDELSFFTTLGIDVKTSKLAYA